MLKRLESNLYLLCSFGTADQTIKWSTWEGGITHSTGKNGVSFENFTCIGPEKSVNI